jgi:hypothetical protein
MNTLPVEILETIAEYLNVYDLKDLIEVSRSFNTVFLPIYLKQCPGCIYNEPGQRAHMQPGGCLSYN